MFDGDNERFLSSSIHTKGPWSWFCKIPTEEERKRSRAVKPKKAPSKTPKWDAVLHNMKGHAPEFLDYIVNQCFYGNLLKKTFRGDDLDEPLSLSLKMEILLNATVGRRDKYVEYLRRGQDLRCNWSNPEEDNRMIFDNNDMKYIMNAWRKDVKSWINREKKRSISIG